MHYKVGYTFKLETEEGMQLKRSYKIYELQKLISSVKYQHDTPIREKREISELEEQPSHKKTKVFAEIILFNKR